MVTSDGFVIHELEWWEEDILYSREGKTEAINCDWWSNSGLSELCQG